MPIWSEILAELHKNRLPNGTPDCDRVRRKYLLALHEYTNRAVVLYASGWLQKDDAPPAVLVNDEDIHGLMEVTSGMQATDVDLILHSPGGSPEAAEAIVSYLRARFDHIRVIIPHLAMSAATMISCAADEIVMGKHSFVGPTDPQMLLATQLGVPSVPAQAVLDQFDRAQRDCADPTRYAAWVPMLSQYGPDLIEHAQTALELSRSLVKTWLETYMFSDHVNAEKQSKLVSDWLAEHSNFKSHSRHLTREMLLKMGMTVIPLESDPELQDKSLSIFHAAMHTFGMTPALKIVESHLGGAFIKIAVQSPMALGIAPLAAPPS